MASRQRKALWTQRALRDLEIIHRFYSAEREVDVTRRLMGQFKVAAKAIAAMPEASPLAQDLMPVGRYRHYLVPPYRIIFRVEPKVVLILRVWDGRKDPQSLAVEG